jgi:hypothetical protein
VLTFFRILFAGIVGVSVVALFQGGIGLAVGVFLLLMVGLWLLMVACDFFVAVGNVLSPSERTELHLHVERHPDPTRPSYEDEHPLIILNRSDYRRK